MTAVLAHKTTERDLREQIRTLVKIYGWRWAFTQYSIRSPKGFPDLVLVRPPRVVFAELKAEKGTMTPEQWEWHDDLAKIAELTDHRFPGPRVEYFVWRPADIDRIAEILR